MKLFLSSGETGTDQIKPLITNGCRYYLYSYYNLKKDVEKYLGVDGEVFLDSGAHTLQKPGKSVNWEEFVSKYIKFINEHSKDIDYFVELDVENKVGLQRVEKWRERIIRETKREPIVVWHRERGWDYYVEMCKRYKYVGFSGFVVDANGGKEVPDKFVKLFIDTAHKYGAKIHGFGYTRPIIKQLDFDSVDSASWKGAVRFGNVFEFRNGQMKALNRRTGFSGQDSYEKLLQNSAREWVKYQKYLDLIS